MGPGDALPSLGALCRSADEGELRGVAWPGPGAFAQRWDRRDDAQTEDHGDIGEDSRGIWVTQHPEVLLSREPALCRLVDRYRRTGCPDVTREDDATLSAFELAVQGYIAQAHHRAVRKRMDDARERRES